MLPMVQLHAVAQDCSPGIYLQVNKSAEAAQYYLHHSFVRMAENTPKQMPETLQWYYSESLSNNVTYPYLYFVTDEQLRQDALRNREDSNSLETISQCLHLHVLKGLLKLTGISLDVKTGDGHVQKCIPDEHGDNSAFLQFPFTDLKQELNNATQDLFSLTISGSSSNKPRMMTFEKKRMMFV